VIASSVARRGWMEMKAGSLPESPANTACRNSLFDRLQDPSAADLQAITNTARRFAFNRAPVSSSVPPLVWAHFEKAISEFEARSSSFSHSARF